MNYTFFMGPKLTLCTSQGVSSIPCTGSMLALSQVPRSSQALLESICNVSHPYSSYVAVIFTIVQNFDGVRRRCLPALYKALESGTEDDRMKGALWTLNLSVFGKSSSCL